MTKSEAADMELRVLAGQWLVRMHEPNCTVDDRIACARWRARSPAHEAAYCQVEDVWRGTAGLGSDPAIVDALRDAERLKSGRVGPHRPVWLPLAIAATVALAAASTFLVWLASRPTVEHVQTMLGEQRAVALADGSNLMLDTSTALTVRYSARERLVELETGQAQFQVERDPKRPFRVRVAGGTVTAIGTQFQVRLEDDQAAVTLLEGSVSVEPPTDSIQHHPVATLSPGQQLHFDRDGRRWGTVNVDLDSVAAWTEGHVFATDWPLERLVTEMNRYSATKLRLSDPTLADLRISGGFRVGDPQALALVIEHSLPVQAAQTGNEIVLSRKAAQRR